MKYTFLLLCSLFVSLGLILAGCSRQNPEPSSAVSQDTELSSQNTEESSRQEESSPQESEQASEEPEENTYPITTEQNVRLTPIDTEEGFGFELHDSTNDYLVGTLLVPFDTGYTRDNIETDLTLRSRDEDQDGLFELGIEFETGEIIWFGLNLESTQFEMLPRDPEFAE